MSTAAKHNNRTSRALAAFGRRIVQLRGDRAWSSAELAERCGLALAELEQFEAGTKSATLDDMRRLAGAFGVPLSQLVDYDRS